VRLEVDLITSDLYRHIYISSMSDSIYGESRIDYSYSLHHLL